MEKRWFWKKIEMDRLISPAILVFLILVVSLVNPAFLQPANLLGLLEQNAAMGVVALGAMFVLITSGIDLTTSNGLTMIAVIACVLYVSASGSFLVLVLAALIAGLVLGAANGLLITRLNLLPFIATLAMMSIAQGVTLLVSEGQIIFLNHPAIIFLGAGKLFNFLPVPFVVFAVMCAISSFVLNWTRMGVYVYSLGDNEEAAVYSGINVRREKLKVYLYAALCTAVGALLVVSRVGQVTPNLGGTIQMDAISAAVIGGTSVSGGKGTVLGTFFGVFIIGIISNALTFMHVPVVAQDAVKGLIILFAIVLDALLHRRKS